MAQQLSLNFPREDVYQSKNFIPHSGVVDVYRSLLEVKKQLTDKSSVEGKFILIFGPKGSGKTHLVKSIFSDFSLKSGKFQVLDFDAGEGQFWDGDRLVSTQKFIDIYQSLKSAPGLFLVLTRGPLLRTEIDPHIYSRLMAGDMYELSYPAEEELLPVLKSIFERYDLRLEDKDLIKIIQQVPAVPECFTAVCEELNRMLLGGEKFKPSLLKAILSKEVY